MPPSGTNLRLALSVNGKRVAISGIESFGVLSAVVSWAKRDPEKFKTVRPRKGTMRDWVRSETRVHFGGLDSRAEQHVTWFAGALKIGDTLTVKVLPPGEFDQPSGTRSPRQTQHNRRTGPARKKAR